MSSWDMQMKRSSHLEAVLAVYFERNQSCGAWCLLYRKYVHTSQTWNLLNTWIFIYVLLLVTWANISLTHSCESHTHTHLANCLKFRHYYFMRCPHLVFVFIFYFRSRLVLFISEKVLRSRDQVKVSNRCKVREKYWIRVWLNGTITH